MGLDPCIISCDVANEDQNVKEDILRFGCSDGPFLDYRVYDGIHDTPSHGNAESPLRDMYVHGFIFMFPDSITLTPVAQFRTLAWLFLRDWRHQIDTGDGLNGNISARTC